MSRHTTTQQQDRAAAAAPEPGGQVQAARGEATASSVFAARRGRLVDHFDGTVLFAAGFSRPRNFPANHLPYRADSHFLYWVGAAPEGSLLRIRDGVAKLFVPPVDPADALWHGQSPSISDWSARLGVEVRPLSELGTCLDACALPHQCPRARAQLEHVLGRPVTATATGLHGRDLELARAVVECRLIHDSAALSQIRQAVAVTAEAFDVGVRHTRPALTEIGLAALMQAEAYGRGCALAYPPIVTAHGEVLHGHPELRPLSPGELVLADVGAESSEGWASDVTRCWPVSARFSATQRAVYQAVHHAHDAALAAVAPGTSFADVHRQSHAALTQALRDIGILRGSTDELTAAEASAIFYPHGVGHLLGLDVHDMEDLGDLAGYPPGRARSPSRSGRYLRLARTLEPDMVLTIEPGFYQVPGLLEEARRDPVLRPLVNWAILEQFNDVRGIRLESDVRVTRTGQECLTQAIPLDVSAIESVREVA